MYFGGINFDLDFLNEFIGDNKNSMGIASGFGNFLFR